MSAPARPPEGSALSLGARDPILLPFGILTVVLLIIVIAPLIILALTAFNATTVSAFPPEGWSLRWFRRVFEVEEFRRSFWLSIGVAGASGLIAIIVGTLAAFALNRYEFRGKELVDGLLMTPLIVPQVITGLALLVFFVQSTAWPPSAQILLLHAMLTMPYAVRVVRASLVQINPKLEEAAIGLGASRLKAFLQVTLPQIRSALFVAVFFCFVVSFDNFTATAFLTFQDITFPVALFQYIEGQVDPTVSAVAALMMLGTTAFVLIADRAIGIHRIT